MRHRTGKLGFLLQELEKKTIDTPRQPSPKTGKTRLSERNHFDTGGDIQLLQKENVPSQPDTEPDEIQIEWPPEKIEVAAREEDETLEEPAPQLEILTDDEEPVNVPVVEEDRPAELSVAPTSLEKHQEYIDDFEKDLMAILEGGVQSKQSKMPTAKPEPSARRNEGLQKPLKTESEIDPHSVFDDMAKGMGQAHTFDLGSFSLPQRFDTFDQRMDREQVFEEEIVEETPEDAIADQTFKEDESLEQPSRQPEKYSKENNPVRPHEKKEDKVRPESLSWGIQRNLEEVRYYIWYNAVVSQKTYFPDEPKTNIDQLPIPFWIDPSSFFEAFINKHGNDALTIIGDRSKKVHARYFVVHDTDTTSDFSKERLESRAEEKGGNPEHLWINAASPVQRTNDWHEKGFGSKVERRRNHCFVHVETVLDPTHYKTVKQKKEAYSNNVVPASEIMKAGGVRSFATSFNDKQYELLAYAYVVASLRRGKLLTVTMHREIDRSVVRLRNGKYRYGHDDPKFFDVDYFYKLIAGLLGIPVIATFGIQNDRALANNQVNFAENVNEFIPFVTGDASAANQYGPLKKLKPSATTYRTVEQTHGYYYDVTDLSTSFDGCKSDDADVD